MPNELLNALMGMSEPSPNSPAGASVPPELAPPDTSGMVGANPAGGMASLGVPQPLAPTPRNRGVLRGLLTNFLGGAGRAMMKSVGLDTPEEAAQKQQLLELRQRSEAIDELFKKSQIEANQSLVKERGIENELVDVPDVGKVRRRDLPAIIGRIQQIESQKQLQKERLDAQKGLQDERLVAQKQMQEERLQAQKDMRSLTAAITAQGTLSPLTNAEGDVVALLNNRTGAVHKFDVPGLRKSGLAGTEITRRANLSIMVEDAGRLEQLAQKNRQALGPVAGRLEGLKQQIVGGEEDTVEMFRISANLADQLLRARSGAQINEQEFRRLRQLLPTPELPEQTFFARLKSFRGELSRLSSRSGAAEIAAPGGGRIRVRRKSDGQTGTVSEGAFDPSKYDRIP